MYTIGQVSEMFGLPISTLRYYDKQGLFTEMERVSGIRKFSDTELEALRVIECLKKSGLEIKDIKQFMDWCVKGASTYSQRKANTGGGNCPYEPSVGYAEIQVLVLWAGSAGWQRRSGAEHDS